MKKPPGTMSNILSPPLASTLLISFQNKVQSHITFELNKPQFVRYPELEEGKKSKCGAILV